MAETLLTQTGVCSFCGKAATGPMVCNDAQVATICTTCLKNFHTFMNLPDLKEAEEERDHWKGKCDYLLEENKGLRARVKFTENFETVLHENDRLKEQLKGKVKVNV